MFEKDPEQEGYLLNLDRVSNNLKDQYDLKGTGLLSIEDKGLTRRDFGEFFSKHRGPIIGGQRLVLPQLVLVYHLQW